MSRIRYREPAIDRYCGSEPGDIAAWLRGKGLEELDMEGLEVLRLDTLHVGRDLGAELECAGAMWAGEDTGRGHGQPRNLWVEPAVNLVVDTCSWHPWWKALSGSGSTQPTRRRMFTLMLRGFLWHLRREPALVPAMEALFTVDPTAAVELLHERGVWKDNAKQMRRHDTAKLQGQRFEQAMAIAKQVAR